VFGLCILTFESVWHEVARASLLLGSAVESRGTYQSDTSQVGVRVVEGVAIL
jgi:hypothetical protein